MSILSLAALLIFYTNVAFIYIKCFSYQMVTTIFFLKLRCNHAEHPVCRILVLDKSFRILQLLFCQVW